MKKILLILALFITSIAANSQGLVSNQNSRTLITYEITTTGSSNGLVIPNPFYVDVIEFNLVRTSTGLAYTAYTKTYTDTLNPNHSVKNDVLPSTIYYPITVSDISTYTPMVIFNNTIRLELKNKYGASNVIVRPINN